METFWHCECISLVSEKDFTDRYRKWCKRKHYHFSLQKAKDIYIESLGHIVTLPKNSNTKLLITTAAKQLTAFKCQLAVLKNEMISLAKQLPEYDTVINLYGVGEENFGMIQRNSLTVAYPSYLKALSKAYPVAAPAKIPGDVNGDKTVDLKDGLLLQQHLAGWKVAVNKTNSDVNGDGVIDLKDGILLKQYLAGWKVTLK